MFCAKPIDTCITIKWIKITNTYRKINQIHTSKYRSLVLWIILAPKIQLCFSNTTYINQTESLDFYNFTENHNLYETPHLNTNLWFGVSNYTKDSLTSNNITSKYKPPI